MYRKSMPASECAATTGRRTGVIRRTGLSTIIAAGFAVSVLASTQSGSPDRPTVDSSTTGLQPVASRNYDGYQAEEYCGKTTCTIYFSRESTRRLDDDMNKRKDSTVVLLAGVPGGLCATAGGAIGGAAGSVFPGPGTAAGIGAGAAAGGAVCSGIAAHKVASLYDHLGDAASNGHCFAVRKPRWTKLGTAEAFYGSEYLVRTTPGRCLD